MIDLSGKCYIVTGVANESSLAWSIALALSGAGALVQLASQSAVLDRAGKLAAANAMPAPVVYDALDPALAAECFRVLRERYTAIHGLVHSIAFSDRAQLKGAFIDMTAENFGRTMHVSCFSLIDLLQRVRRLDLMPPGGSIVSLTFDASRGSYPHYNAMALAKAALESSVVYAATELGEVGLRVNAISASPTPTLAARGIGDFPLIRGYAEAMSPLGRRATPGEIANEALYLLSPLSSGVTGQVRFVDCGSSICKMPPARHADRMAQTMNAVHAAHAKATS